MSTHEIVNGEVSCRAEPGAPCRLGCPARACEEWSDHCSHGALVDAGYCYAAEWINAAGVDDSCWVDDGTVPEDFAGPVDVEWTGDSYIWSPAEVRRQQAAGVPA